MITRIKNGTLLLDRELLEQTYLYFEDGKITHITQQEYPYDREIDARGKYVSSGFIELHVHGGGGYEFIDAAREAILEAANMHGRHGTTTLYPTLSSFDLSTTCQALKALNQYVKDEAIIPNIPGIHLEGPYFSPKQCGAQDPAHIRAPKEEEYTALLREYGALVKRWSYAPERDEASAFQDYLAAHGIIGSAGHTDAEYCHMKQAYEHGCRLITHLYSCTSTITRKGGFRCLGVIESAYLLDQMDVEAIADGCHLPSELLQLIYKIKGPDHMCLVTDAIRYGGMTDCESVQAGTKNVPYIIEDGVAKLPDRSAFAGSIATADVLIRTCTQRAGIPLTDAVHMMTEVPARIMGLQNKGRLTEGYDADIILFNENIEISTVIVNGSEKFNNASCRKGK